MRRTTTTKPPARTWAHAHLYPGSQKRDLNGHIPSSGSPAPVVFHFAGALSSSDVSDAYTPPASAILTTIIVNLTVAGDDPTTLSVMKNGVEVFSDDIPEAEVHYVFADLAEVFADDEQLTVATPSTGFLAAGLVVECIFG